MRSTVTFILLLFTLFCSGQGKIINPILPGFYPDPSICFDGKSYYLVNSSFAYFPGIPIFKSDDMVNWKQVGNVISKPSQMDFMGEQLSRGLFAPAINYHNGLYYITCTNIDHLGNFVVTAKNAAGPWSNPIPLPNARGIDPSLFFDDNKAYIVYNSDAPDNKPLYSGHRTIRMYEFDPVNIKTIGNEVLLVNGGVDISKKPVWIEGPHIYKRNNYYYLMAAEGGTSVNHSEVVLRSRSVDGPYIPYEHNPILTQRDLDPNRKNSVTSTGHADLIKGPDGNTYAVFLGVRPYEGDYYNTGRETFMAPVKWQDDWPIINPGQEEVQYTYNVGFATKPIKNTAPLNGNFSERLDFKQGVPQSLLFLRTLDTTWFKTGKAGLTVNLKAETCMGRDNPAFIGRRQQHLICSATTKLTFAAASENEKAGITAFADEFHFYYICRSVKANGISVIQLFKGDPQTKDMQLITETDISAQNKTVFLRINAVNNQYSFEYALSPNQWKVLDKNVDGQLLSTKVAGGFVGSLFGLYATSSGKTSKNTATFAWLDYTGNDVIYNQN
jgi:xylan 1,4-beta-xylosidase